MGNGQCRPALPYASTDEGRQTACPIKFPMHVVPLDVFLSLRRLKPFQELSQQGLLVKFHAQMGNVIFVSHQWLKKLHPDPHFQQTRVLQEALKNLLSGRSSVASQVGIGCSQHVRIEDLTSKPLYIWYDYMSCPQLVAAKDDPGVVQSLHNAVESIPGYVQKSAFFFILAPPIQHMETGNILSYASWKARGWCRLERAAHSLALESMAAPVVVEGPERQYMAHHMETLLQPVGAGEFRSEYDKKKAASLLRAMVTRKMMFYQDAGDVHRFRVMLNTRHLYLQNLPLDDSICPGSPQALLSTNPLSSDAHLAMFLRRNGFESAGPNSQDWPPLIAAALAGGASLVAALLKAEADVNYQVTEPEPTLNVSCGMSALHICSMLGHNNAMMELIAGRADVNIPDSQGKTALDRAHEMGNRNGVLQLLSAGVNPIPGRDDKIPEHTDILVSCCVDKARPTDPEPA